MNRRPAAIIAFALLLLPPIVVGQPEAHNIQQPGEQAVMETLYTGQQCGRNQTTASATWIDNARQLEASIKRIRGTMSGGNSPLLPKPDFQHEIALLVEMGQRPTLGYQISLTGSDDLRITQGQAHLVLDWVQPPADAMVAQMISSPCLLLKLKRGNYTSIQVLDKQGTIRAASHRRH
ncbi:MAG: protease complex subunit PrcB family protein [Gammaproteobacteria bacterium]|nr:protease complex subunit PrcB family protein [Gammaproteobacteria bacterium]